MENPGTCTVPLKEQHGHPDIVITYNKAASPLVEWLQGYFAEAVAEGTVFRAQQTVQIGWMLLMLREAEDGQLAVWEPGFHAMPIEWVSGASNALCFLLVQREVCDRLKVEPEFPTIIQPAVIPASFLKRRGGFIMDRSAPEAGHSGWALRQAGLIGRWTRAVQQCSLFEVALHRKAVIPFLALPAGSMVRISANEINIYCQNRSCSSGTDPFLRDLLDAKAFN